MATENHIARYVTDARSILQDLDQDAIQAMVEALAALRARQGRLFFLGVGGGAANASHAVNDFRKIAGIESYAVTDNVAELTARINDDGWETAFANYLEGSHIGPRDGVFVFSVGGGNQESNVSVNLVRAVQAAKTAGAAVFGVVGRDGGYTAKVADHCIVVPVVNGDTVTPHTESFQALVWHMIVSHPQLALAPGKWESVTGSKGASAPAIS